MTATSILTLASSSALTLPPRPERDNGVHTPDAPTEQLYTELLTAHRHFNECLFGGYLPDVVFSVRAKANSLGYFAPSRFAAVANDAIKTHEIAMNPKTLRDRPLKASLSTLVHEQAHLFCEIIGKGAKGSYHDKNWARVMEAIGLMPSHTGEVGGRKTGHRVTHYVIEGGPFDVAADALIATGFQLTYFDAWQDAPRSSGGRRTKFVCGSCGLAAWSQPSAALLCAACISPMTAATP